ncbi:hypothetical protein GEV33_000210 [Tenebrio molitor]|uniref:Uncharacterized protein n=1 Tax=Tenebrio molitor TaxID=7067 RepID=A0A8J6HZQ7_TENMO|nr:hypothetical protein GEV33_000210 [Tenebrio molitor]
MRGVGERIRKPVGQIKLTYSTERRRKGDRMDERGREKERNDREGERTSTLWKLNSDKTKVVEASSFHQVMPYPEGPNGVQFIVDDDPVFNIITSTVHLGQSWVKERVEYYCTNCPSMKTDK